MRDGDAVFAPDPRRSVPDDSRSTPPRLAPRRDDELPDEADAWSTDSRLTPPPARALRAASSACACLDAEEDAEERTLGDVAPAALLEEDDELEEPLEELPETLLRDVSMPPAPVPSARVPEPELSAEPRTPWMRLPNSSVPEPLEPRPEAPYAEPEPPAAPAPPLAP